MKRMHTYSGLSYGEIGRLLKYYDKQYIALAVVLAKKYNKADNIGYIIELIKLIKYNIELKEKYI